MEESPSAEIAGMQPCQGSLPVNYGMIVYPAFQAIDVFGPLDALNMLSAKFPMNLSIIAKTLHPVSTQLPAKSNPFKSKFSESVVPTHTFSSPPKHLDVLLIPGGLGVTDATEAKPSDIQEIIDYVKATYPSLRYLITVCTGATLASRAGILDGKNATTNKAVWYWAIKQGPKVNWISHARWVVDGNIYTTSGVSAGIDGTFAFIKDIYGEEAAESVANSLEYKRWLDSSNDPFADLYHIP